MRQVRSDQGVAIALLPAVHDPHALKAVLAEPSRQQRSHPCAADDPTSGVQPGISLGGTALPALVLRR